jgi:guanylate kinase
MVTETAFVEWARYLDQYYGTSYGTVKHALEHEIDLLFDIEINGARQIKDRFSDAFSIFLLPPSFAVLKARLLGRATDDLDKVHRRLLKGLEELKYAPNFDYLVLNESLEEAMTSLEMIRDGRGDQLPDQRVRLAGIIEDMSAFLIEADRLGSML